MEDTFVGARVVGCLSFLMLLLIQGHDVVVRGGALGRRTGGGEEETFLTRYQTNVSHKWVNTCF